jgi:hypothetical protein
MPMHATPVLKKCLSLLLIALSAGIPGCMATNTLLYSGPPKAPGEVAYLNLSTLFDANTLTDSGYISTIRSENEAGGKKLALVQELEIVSGNYIVGLCYRNLYTNLSAGEAYSSTAYVEQTIRFEPGNAYFVFSKIETASDGKYWKPTIINLKDYNKEQCDAAFNRVCPSKDQLAQRVEAHFHGGRTPLSFVSPLNSNTAGIPDMKSDCFRSMMMGSSWQ